MVITPINKLIMGLLSGSDLYNYPWERKAEKAFFRGGHHCGQWRFTNDKNEARIGRAHFAKFPAH